MKYEIDTTSPTALYLQIADQIERRILAGSLAQGEPLPSVRDLAVLLVVNPNTVMKSYQLLQSKGLILSRPGAGFWIENISSSECNRKLQGLLKQRLDEFIDEAFELGLSASELINLLQERLSKRKENF